MSRRPIQHTGNTLSIFSSLRPKPLTLGIQWNDAAVTEQSELRSSSVDVWVCLDVLSHRFLQLLFFQLVASDVVITPQPGWRRPRGRRRISWLHQVCTNLNLPASDATLPLIGPHGGQSPWLPGYALHDNPLPPK